MRLGKYFFSLLLLELCAIFVKCQQEKSPILQALVPKIDQPNYQLIPDGQKYKLIINLPDGSSRVEDVELRSPNTPKQELHVTGTRTELFPEGLSVVVNYEAGINGYRAKYQYGGPPLPPATFGPFFISANGLKSAAG